MGVYIKDQSKLWPRVPIMEMQDERPGPQNVVRPAGWARVVPYYTTHVEVHRPITSINGRLGGPVFWRIDDVRSFQNSQGCKYYVEIRKGGGSCTVGCQYTAGGRQVLNYDSVDNNLVHELGHCLGLGHENFHTDWPGAEEILSKDNLDIHKVQYIMNQKKYHSWGDFDASSAMLYSDEAFLDSIGVVAKALMQDRDKGRRGSIASGGARGLGRGFVKDDVRILGLNKAPSVEKKVAKGISGIQKQKGPRRFSVLGPRALEARGGERGKSCVNNSFSASDILLIKHLYSPGLLHHSQ